MRNSGAVQASELASGVHGAYVAENSMDISKPTTVQRRWLPFASIFSPLALAFLWCAFVDQEGFGAFVLGVLFTLLFAVVALVTFLVKKLIEERRLRLPTTNTTRICTPG